ncbi:MAG: CDP-diacylglycerol--glycerol-3-phosphate 3-phosphatidyltransferase [Polyangiaceae bacterium]|nr:CDP-diacylglycerol--glycerol-3-phosphate 3-phosphatidyltransferase [Polyangiaceae bacterium]
MRRVTQSDPPAASRRWRRPRRRAIDPALRDARRRSLRQDVWNLPNMLTMGRVVIIPLVLWLLWRGSPQDCAWAAIAYGVAAITDLLDGYLARKMNVVSVLGKFLDPLADKLIVMATLIWMVPMGRIPEWAVALLLAREITITALRSIASSEGVVIAAGGGGKSKTALQMIGIVCLIVGYPYELTFLGFYDLGVVDLVVVGRWLVYISLIFSITSAVEYFGLFAQAVEAKERRASPPSH